jgi:hypothetical protein
MQLIARLIERRADLGHVLSKMLRFLSHELMQLVECLCRWVDLLAGDLQVLSSRRGNVFHMVVRVLSVRVLGHVINVHCRRWYGVGDIQRMRSRF